MGSYEKLFKSGASETDIVKIKRAFAGKPDITAWEDYYWASKCIIRYDTSDVDSKFISGMINSSLKYGLTYRANKELYLDAIKMLASIYALMGKYELVLNCLNSVIELDHDTPDWVFHDLVSAQNKTRSIKKNLKRPAMFLSDLAHNDGNKPETRRKQQNIFKEFLEAGIVYLVKNPDAAVDVASITNAAEEYGVTDAKEWAVFEDACRGKMPEKIKKRAEHIALVEETNKQQEEETAGRTEGKPTKKRPLVISLFKENASETDDSSIANEEKQDKELVEKLSSAQAELESKNKELETAGAALEKLTEINKSLQASVEKNQADKADYEKKLNDKNKSIEDLNKKLKLADEGSAEKEKIEKQLAKEKAEKSELSKRVSETNETLAKLKKTLKNAETDKQKAVAEKENLKEELAKAQRIHQADMADYERKIQEKEKNIEALNKELAAAKDSSEKKEIKKQLAAEQEQKQKMAKQLAAEQAQKQKMSKQLATEQEQKQKMAKEMEENKRAWDQKFKNAEMQAQQAETEKTKLKEELDKAEKKNQKLVAEKAGNIRGNCKEFEYVIAKKTASWLTERLLREDGDWDQNILRVLTIEQKTRATEGHYRKLEEFDLAALLRIFSRNWRTLSRSLNFTDSNKKTLDQMFDVRNNLAHSNAAPIDKSAVVQDLEVMSAFLNMMGYEISAGKISKYAREVVAMKLT